MHKVCLILQCSEFTLACFVRWRRYARYTFLQKMSAYWIWLLPLHKLLQKNSALVCEVLTFCLNYSRFCIVLTLSRLVYFRRVFGLLTSNDVISFLWESQKYEWNLYTDVQFQIWHQLPKRVTNANLKKTFSFKFSIRFSLKILKTFYVLVFVRIGTTENAAIYLRLKTLKP